MPKSRVLVIDDDPMITQLLREHLSNEGYEVAIAGMAEEGFAAAVETSPDLIFLDVMLPDATGFQMLGRLRENPTTKAIPIIMMSGTARYANQQEIGKNMGANAYVVKPFNVIEVGEKARELIETSRDGISKNEIREVPESLSEPDPTPALPIEIKPETKIEEPLDFKLEPIVFMNELQEESPPIEMPIKEKPTVAPEAAASRDWRLVLTAGLFSAHIVMTGIGAHDSTWRAVSYVLGGWALLLGLLVAACATLKITLDAREALRILGWPAIPIVTRELLSMTGVIHLSSALSLKEFWLRPLDLFEIASIVILGALIRLLPGSSTRKSMIAAGLIALAWCLTSRGYFLPF